MTRDNNKELLFSAKRCSTESSEDDHGASVPVPVHQLQHPLQQDGGGEGGIRPEGGRHCRGVLSDHEAVGGRGGSQVIFS